MTDELYHYGIKGMKWGVRRTPEQLGRLSSEGSLKSLSSITKESQKIVNVAKGRSDRVKKKKKEASEAKMNLEKMSDKELRDLVNRRILENQYRQLYSSNNVSKGRRRVDGILDGIGTALTVSSSALAIALSVKKLTG